MAYIKRMPTGDVGGTFGDAGFIGSGDTPTSAGDSQGWYNIQDFLSFHVKSQAALPSTLLLHPSGYVPLTKLFSRYKIAAIMEVGKYKQKKKCNTC